MGIFRWRSRRISSQIDFEDFSLFQRLREDFSQSSELIERMGERMGNSRGRLALFGVVLMLLMLVFLFVTILLFGAPTGTEKEFMPVGAAGLVPSGTVGVGGLL